MAVKTVQTQNFQSEVLAAGTPVLVDFWAAWCGPCQMLSPIIEELATARSDVQFCKVNIDEEPSLAEQYGVMSIPTLILFKNGEVVNTTVGLRSREAIEAMLK